MKIAPGQTGVAISAARSVLADAAHSRQRAIDARPIGARYLRGRALALLGRLGEAMVEIRQVLAADPENADALRAIAMLEQARVHRAKRPWWRFWN